MIMNKPINNGSSCRFIKLYTIVMECIKQLLVNIYYSQVIGKQRLS